LFEILQVSNFVTLHHYHNDLSNKIFLILEINNKKNNFTEFFFLEPLLRLAVDYYLAYSNKLLSVNFSSSKDSFNYEI